MRWRILGLLFLLSFVAYVLRLNLSVAAVQVMPELGLTEVQMGWVFSAFVWAYTIFQLPGGLFGQAVGARRALAVLALLWGVVTVLTGWLPGLLAGTGGALALLLATRFLIGAVQAPLFPVVAGAIERWFPLARWALPNAVSSTGLGLGAAFTPPLIAWLMVELGWRQSFYLTAPIALAIGWTWWRYARDEPAEHAATNGSELALIRAERVPEEPARLRLVLPRLLRNRDALLISLSYTCMNYVFYIFFNWFYLYLIEVRGFSLLEGGLVAALPWVVGALMASVGGELCDRLCRRIGPVWGCRLPCLVGLGLVAVFLLAGAVATSAFWAVVLLTLCFASTQLSEGAYWSGMTFVAGRHTAAATGVLNTGGNLGGVISSPLIPIFVGWFGWLGALATGSVFAVIGAALWLGVRVDRPLLADTE